MVTPRYALKEARHAVVLIILRGQIKTAGETPKSAPSRLTCSFVIERLPLTISNAVSQRTREIGIRMALGARRSDVMMMVIGQGIKFAGAGILIGLGGALALTRFMETLVFGVSATDPLTYVTIVSLLTVVALLACWIPARRATKVDPLLALRCE